MAFLCLTSITSTTPLTHACTHSSEPMNVCVQKKVCVRERGRQTGMAGEGECFLKEPVEDMVGGGSVGAGVRKCAACDVMAGCA